jgi:hypothetical protein
VTPRRWTRGHGIAVFELACAVVAVGYAFAVRIEGEVAGTPGRSVLNRIFPFLLGAAGGGVLIMLAVRSWRAANRESEAGQLTAEPRPAPPPQPLTVDEKREVARVVDVLAAAGVFVPLPPDPAQLHEAVAEADELVAVDVVLAALAEADRYEPDFRASDHCANLAFHDSHVEQDDGGQRGQVDDLVRLAGDGLAGVAVVVELGRPGPDGRVPTRPRIRVDEDEQVINYTRRCEVPEHEPARGAGAHPARAADGLPAGVALERPGGVALAAARRRGRSPQHRAGPRVGRGVGLGGRAAADRRR